MWGVVCGGEGVVFHRWVEIAHASLCFVRVWCVGVRVWCFTSLKVGLRSRMQVFVL